MKLLIDDEKGNIDEINTELLIVFCCDDDFTTGVHVRGKGNMKKILRLIGTGAGVIAKANSGEAEFVIACLDQICNAFVKSLDNEQHIESDVYGFFGKGH